MAAVPERGFLLIADITGYTSYLARGEIEHAPTIAGDLLETIVGRLEPPFRLAKLEGDAAFLFVEDGRTEASLLLDRIEAAYLAFRRRLRSIEQATACDCNACSHAPRLNLKFLVHHGQYVRTAIAGRDEVAGSSVIVVHRLLKGTTIAAAQRSGGQAAGVAVLTADALVAMGVSAEALGTSTSVDDIEHIGTIATHIVDLEARWQSETGQRRIVMEAGGVTIDLETILPADPATVWAYLTAPGLRPAWEGPITIVEVPEDGPLGVGGRTECITGRLATLEEIVDWQPHDHVGYRLAIPDLGVVEATYDLASDPGGTSIRLRWTAASLPKGGADLLARMKREKQDALERLGKVLAVNMVGGMAQ